MATAASERAGLEAEVVERALTDDDFRKALVGDAKGTIEKEYDVQLPAELEIQVVEETASSLCLVLPFAPIVNEELTSSEVDAAEDCSGWKSASECAFTCTQCGNNGTTCAPGPTEDNG